MPICHAPSCVEKALAWLFAAKSVVCSSAATSRRKDVVIFLGKKFFTRDALQEWLVLFLGFGIIKRRCVVLVPLAATARVATVWKIWTAEFKKRLRKGWRMEKKKVKGDSRVNVVVFFVGEKFEFSIFAAIISVIILPNFSFYLEFLDGPNYEFMFLAH